MSPEDLHMLRRWRSRGAALLLLVVLTGLREVPTARPTHQVPVPDRFLEANNEAANEEAKNKPKPKECSPACKAPSVCADGTCVLPASRPAALPGEHSEAQMTWVLDSLR